MRFTRDDRDDLAWAAGGGGGWGATCSWRGCTGGGFLWVGAAGAEAVDGGTGLVGTACADAAAAASGGTIW